jgi:hypothetical protein
VAEDDKLHKPHRCLSDEPMRILQWQNEEAWFQKVKGLANHVPMRRLNDYIVLHIYWNLYFYIHGMPGGLTQTTAPLRVVSWFSDMGGLTVNLTGGRQNLTEVGILYSKLGSSMTWNCT